VVGVGIDRLVYRPLRMRKAPSLTLLIASFGTDEGHFPYFRLMSRHRIVVHVTQ